MVDLPINTLLEGITVAGILAVLAGVGLFLERISAWRANKLIAKNAPNDAAAQLTSAATNMANAVDDLLTPLRAEVAALRKETDLLREEARLLRVEVQALRSTLIKHGIPHPFEHGLSLKDAAEVATDALEQGLRENGPSEEDPRKK